MSGRRSDDCHHASLEALLHRILAQFRALSPEVHTMAADVSSIKGLVSAIDAETNTVAAKVDAQTQAIAALQARLDAGGSVTSEDLQAIQDELQPISDRLQAIGSDPAQPIPPATDAG